MERSSPSKQQLLALLLVLLLLAPPLQARELVGGSYEEQRRLRLPSAMSASDRAAAKLDDDALPGLGRPGGLVPPALTHPPPPHYRLRRGAGRRPADVLGALREAIVRYVTGA
ncbi:hypothetical protein ACP4OV_021181 [Aristida adscensionis]